MNLSSRHLVCFYICLVILPLSAFAHNVGQSYIYLSIYEESMAGRFEINMAEVNTFLGIQLNDGKQAAPTMEEVEPYLPQIQEYLTSRIRFEPDAGPLDIIFTTVDILNVGSRTGSFLLLHFDLPIANIPEKMRVSSEVLFDQDPSHECWLMIEYNWKAGVYNNEAIPSLIFDLSTREQMLSLSDGSLMKGFLAMIYQGMKHIWIGLDHILFLLALVLPAVISRKKEPDSFSFAEKMSTTGILAKMSPLFPSWMPLNGFRAACINVFKVVTFFTIAHTITLSLAALEIIVLPGRLVESIIAFSIALAAFHNIRPFFKNEWLIVFGFGLFHGFGFASVMGDLGLSGEYLVLSLLGFNIGVEIGQLVIIALIFPVLFFIRRTRLYPGVFVYGSVFLILLSLYWFFGRSLGFEVFGEDIIIEIYAWLRSVFLPA